MQNYICQWFTFGVNVKECIRITMVWVYCWQEDRIMFVVISSFAGTTQFVKRWHNILECGCFKERGREVDEGSKKWWAINEAHQKSPQKHLVVENVLESIYVLTYESGLSSFTWHNACFWLEWFCVLFLVHTPASWNQWLGWILLHPMAAISCAQLTPSSSWFTRGFTIANVAPPSIMLIHYV